MRRLPLLALLLGSGGALVPSAVRADEPAAPLVLPKGLSIGDAAPAMEAKDLDGKAWSLADARSIPHERALAAVLDAAKAFGSADAKPEDAIDRLPGVIRGSAVDPAKRLAFVQAAGHAFGLIASTATTQAWKALAEVVAWIEGSAAAPIVLMCWASGCPTAELYEERVAEAFATTKARLFMLACDANDPDRSIRKKVDEDHVPYRILMDKEQRLTDVLGGRRTPHVFLFDEKNVLRYAGSIDNDPASTEPAGKRAEWLKEALLAVTEGRSVDVLLTAPKGCTIKRRK